MTLRALLTSADAIPFHPLLSPPAHPPRALSPPPPLPCLATTLLRPHTNNSSIGCDEREREREDGGGKLGTTCSFVRSAVNLSIGRNWEENRHDRGHHAEMAARKCNLHSKTQIAALIFNPAELPADLPPQRSSAQSECVKRRRRLKKAECRLGPSSSSSSSLSSYLPLDLIHPRLFSFGFALRPL